MRERRGHYTAYVATDLLPGGEVLPAKMDFSTRGLWLPPDQLGLAHTPVQAAYPFDTGFPVPVIRVDENVAEKLGRWQERPLVRDLYDLAALATSISDPHLVTRMWVLKCHAGMTSGSRRGPVGPAASIDDLTADKRATPFVLDDLVLPADPPDTAKRALVEADLAKVDRLCRTVAAHMTPRPRPLRRRSGRPQLGSPPRDSRDQGQLPERKITPERPRWVPLTRLVTAGVSASR